MCEEIALKYNSKDFNCTIIRPATVCGYSRRQRLDVVVNILTNLAYNKKKIQIFGGKQLRPNINIFDMCNVYIHLLNQPEEKINGEVFNVGYENSSLNELGILVKNSMPFDIEVENVKTDDIRSYHISSEKIKKKIGFENKKNIKNAIDQLIIAFQKNLLPNSLHDEMYFNIKRMNKINLK